MTKLFELSFDNNADPWFLSDPHPWLGEWHDGGRAESVDRVRFEVTAEGRRLDLTVSRGLVVVKEWVGELIEGLAPADVQRIPAHIGGEDERYELLHVSTSMDCVDWERTQAQVVTNGTVANGTLASLRHLIDRSRLYRYVRRGNIVLDPRGIDGARIFRVADWELYAVVTEPIKQALEEAQVSGVEFLQVGTFGGHARRAAEHPGRVVDEQPPTLARWHKVLDAHCERYLGPWRAFGEIIPTSEYAITIYAHHSPDRAVQTLRTAGVSDYPLHVPAGSAHPRRCELLTYVPTTYDPEDGDESDLWPERMLRLLGQFVHEEETWFAAGHTVLLAEPGEVYVPGTLISAVLFRSPTAESSAFDELEIDGEPCRFLWAYPITEAERSYAVDNGGDALRTLIAASAFDLGLEARRPCLVSGRRP